jgi:hypothetical protein
LPKDEPAAGEVLRHQFEREGVRLHFEFRAVRDLFFCSKLATNFLWQQRTSSRTAVLGFACAALVLSGLSGHESATG